MMRPALRQEDFDTEKNVILEEIAKYDDQPPYGVHEKCMAAFFGGHPLGNSVLGTSASVGGLERDQMLAYFERRVSARETWCWPLPAMSISMRCAYRHRIIAAAGPCSMRPRQTPAAKPHKQFQIIHKPLAVQEYVVQLSPAPSSTDEDRYAARLLATIIGDETGSRLFWELVDTGVAESASIGVQEFQGAGVFLTCLSCLPDLTADNMQRIAEIVNEAQSEGLMEEELEQAKNKMCRAPGAASRTADESDVFRRQCVDSPAAIQDSPRRRRELSRGDARRRPARAEEVSTHRRGHRRGGPADRVSSAEVGEVE